MLSLKTPVGGCSANMDLVPAAGVDPDPRSAWRQSGLGAPDDIDHLKHQIITLEQQTVDLRLRLEEREQDLDAARAANRELIARLNTPQQAT